MKRSISFNSVLKLSFYAVLVIGIAFASLYLGRRDGAASPVVLPEPPLRELAHTSGIEIGSFAALKYLGDDRYSNILSSQFDFAIVDGQPNWSFEDGDLRSGRHDFDFRRLDQVFDYARMHNMPARGQHFVWGEEKWLPGWLKDGHYSKQELNDILKEHILTVGERYRGRAREWTVVNEAFTRQQHSSGLRDWWFDAVGDNSYIDNSFIWAHQADPNAKLIINDFNNEVENPYSNAMYDYVKSAKARGIPIDGVGFQMHIGADKPPDKDAVIRNMQRFKALGVDVYITELDVQLHDIYKPADEELQIQAKIYRDMLDACIDSKACKSFGLLGITDPQSWYNGLGIHDADPLTFNAAYQPKPAYFALYNDLKTRKDALDKPN